MCMPGSMSLRDMGKTVAVQQHKLVCAQAQSSAYLFSIKPNHPRFQTKDHKSNTMLLLTAAHHASHAAGFPSVPLLGCCCVAAAAAVAAPAVVWPSAAWHSGAVLPVLAVCASQMVLMKSWVVEPPGQS